jgi:hypothetical protein
MDARFLLAHTCFANVGRARGDIAGSDDGDDDDNDDAVAPRDTRQHPPRARQVTTIGWPWRTHEALAEKSYRHIVASPAGGARHEVGADRPHGPGRAACCAPWGVPMLEDLTSLDAALVRLGTADAEDTIADLTGQYYQAMADQGELAMGHFREADQQHTDIGSTDSSRAAAAASTTYDATTPSALEFDYATVLHNLATASASTYRGRDHHERTAEYARQAIAHYQAVRCWINSRIDDVSVDARERREHCRRAENDGSIAAVPSAVGELLLLVPEVGTVRRQQGSLYEVHGVVRAARPSRATRVDRDLRTMEAILWQILNRPVHFKTYNSSSIVRRGTCGTYSESFSGTVVSRKNASWFYRSLLYSLWMSLAMVWSWMLDVPS